MTSLVEAVQQALELLTSDQVVDVTDPHADRRRVAFVIAADLDGDSVTAVSFKSEGQHGALLVRLAREFVESAPRVGHTRNRNAPTQLQVSEAQAKRYLT